MSTKSILIVDDNPTNLKLVKVLLAVEGYKTDTAKDAKEVFEKLKSFHPDLILMDIQLPGTDGLELTRQIKQDAAYKNVKVLAITAYAISGDKEKALAAGCDGYVAKPIDTQTLPKIIAEYLR